MQKNVQFLTYDSCLAAPLKTWGEIATNCVLSDDVQKHLENADKIIPIGCAYEIAGSQFLKIKEGHFRVNPPPSLEEDCVVCRFHEDGSFLICCKSEIGSDGPMFTLDTRPIIRVTRKALLLGVFPQQIMANYQADQLFKTLRGK